MSGKLIVIEGADGAGKGEQFRRLAEYLDTKGDLTTFDFPQYESLFGQVIGKALHGEYGDFSRLSPELSTLPYMLDRYLAKGAIKEALARGTVMCNRYVTANTLYAAARLPLGKREEIIKFVAEAEYDVLGLPRPDLVLFLHLSAETSHELVAKKAARSYTTKQHDVNEENQELQRSVVEVGNYLCETFPEWHQIDCEESGELLPIEAIHEKIKSVVDSLLV